MFVLLQDKMIFEAAPPRTGNIGPVWGAAILHQASRAFRASFAIYEFQDVIAKILALASLGC